jgi:lysine-specific demethylase 8
MNSLDSHRPLDIAGPPSPEGPTFGFVPEIPWDALRTEGPKELKTPLLLKGAVKAWPAWENWTFEKLARLRRPGGDEVVCRFQEGLVEQGKTQPLPRLPVAPYLRELAEASLEAPRPPEGLLSNGRRGKLSPTDRFLLDWTHLRRLPPDRRYLADWPILQEFPELRRDFEIRTLWPGLRWTWEYVFIGPAHTVTGLHRDIHNNWFCQVRGTKELILFPPEESPRMCSSGKYNLGSVLSTIDISRLHEQPEESALFSQTRGIYVRAEAGDALYIPKNTWHAVVALEPSISLGVFGLNAWEIATEGAWAEFKNVLHRLRLYRWRNCICHEALRS